MPTYRPAISDNRAAIILQGGQAVSNNILEAGNNIAGNISTYGSYRAGQKQQEVNLMNERDEMRAQLEYLTDDPEVLNKFDSGSIGSARGLYAQEMTKHSMEMREQQQAQALGDYFAKADYRQQLKMEDMQMEDMRLKEQAVAEFMKSGVSSTAAKELAKRSPNGEVALSNAQSMKDKEEMAWLYDATRKEGEVDIRKAPSAAAAKAYMQMAPSKQDKPKAGVYETVLPDGTRVLQNANGSTIEVLEAAPDGNQGGMPQGGGDVSVDNPLFYFGN